MNNSGYGGAHLMLAFIAGAVTGACAAILTTPQTGTEARHSLRGWAHDAQGTATRVPEAVRAAYGRASTAAKQAFTEALQKEAPSPTVTSIIEDPQRSDA